MIRKFIGRMFGRGRAASRSRVRTTPHHYRATDLGIKHSDVSSAAMRTCEGLQKAGFKAYIVGGGVRDAIANLKPKDFDVSTDATPQQVVQLFRRSRLIGKRFQIVHVIFGRETIEVSTFRSPQANAETDDHGRVLRDNVWGSHVKQVIKRKQPHFSESFYGFRSFNDLLETARDKGLLVIEKDQRSGGYRILEFGEKAEA